MVEFMPVQELQNFLRLRDLKVTGRKKELVARVWCAIQQDIPIQPTAQHVEEQLKIEFKERLKIDGITLPDPYLLLEGWLSEEEGGLTSWPMVLYPDIFNYLAFYPSELGSKDLSDYKQSKAYSYFKTGWLKGLKYNSISPESKICILKSECRKSEKLRDPLYELWIAIEKNSGKIRSAHCKCMSGMLSTCNHVAAGLFRIEAPAHPTVVQWCQKKWCCSIPRCPPVGSCPI